MRRLLTYLPPHADPRRGDSTYLLTLRAYFRSDIPKASLNETQLAVTRVYMGHLLGITPPVHKVGHIAWGLPSPISELNSSV